MRLLSRIFSMPSIFWCSSQPVTVIKPSLSMLIMESCSRACSAERIVDSLKPSSSASILDEYGTVSVRNIMPLELHRPANVKSMTHIKAMLLPSGRRRRYLIFRLSNMSVVIFTHLTSAAMLSSFSTEVRCRRRTLETQHRIHSRSRALRLRWSAFCCRRNRCCPPALPTLCACSRPCPSICGCRACR